MMYTITLPVFEGPLDLLLRLIERSELDITSIALAEVADQYLAYVRSMDAPDPRALSEFISMAARLLLIKSRALLPRREETTAGTASDEDDAETLARQLREYRYYKQAAAMLRTWADTGRQTFLRTAPTPTPASEPPPLDHNLADLIAAVQRRIQLMLPLDEDEALVLPPRLTVAQVTAQLRARLKQQAWCSFEDVLSTATTRREVIVAFWAVLEMLKRQVVVVEQSELFGTISIGRGPNLDATIASEEETRVNTASQPAVANNR